MIEKIKIEKSFAFIKSLDSNKNESTVKVDIKKLVEDKKFKTKKENVYAYVLKKCKKRYDFTLKLFFEELIKKLCNGNKKTIKYYMKNFYEANEHLIVFKRNLDCKIEYDAKEMTTRELWHLICDDYYKNKHFEEIKMVKLKKKRY